ncbi:MAG: glycine/betaine ABC transporter substrate-binding protein [Rubrobacter sp.]|nr:glycine/betaine ABC transporter substrate-binding protein [Rubrobacter sp.]
MALAKRLRISATLALTVALTLTASACGGSGGGGDAGSITIGSKNFTEQEVLGEMYAQKFEAEGYDVSRELDLGSVQVLDRALRDGQIDMYPEYTGTALESVFTEDYEQYIEENGDPESPEETYDIAERFYEERDPAMTLAEQAGYNNTYGIAVARPVAEEYGIENLSDLAEASPNLTFASFGEFQEREDGFANIEENYPQTNFEEIEIVSNIGLKYSALQEGEADVAPGFTTDGQLASDDLIVAEDEKNIWPFYHPAPVFRSEYLNNNEQAAQIANEVTETLTLDTMQQLNGRVDVDQESPEDVAREHLESEGLL